MTTLKELDDAEMMAGWMGVEVRRIGDCLLINGDSADALPLLGEACVAAVVTDPPYGLSKEPDMHEVFENWISGRDYEHRSAGFMGKTWDSFVPGPALWSEVVRTLKPGGHMLAFAGSRTYDLMAVAIRLAEMEIRDQVLWVYGSGFPKSHNISKAIDKMAGAEREVVGAAANFGASKIADGKTTFGDYAGAWDITVANTDDAKAWDGWGTALKPSHEPCVLARKPFPGTVAANVLEHGTGAINIDGCRIPGVKPQVTQGVNSNPTSFAVAKTRRTSGDPNEGRFPANLIHDGSDEVLAHFPHDSARFSYTAKPSSWERDIGLDDLPEQAWHQYQTGNGESGKPSSISEGRDTKRRNIHPTVKPIQLMRYLIRLVAPPGGVVLDPFLGSGTTGMAAVLEGVPFIGIERDPAYFEIACARIAAVVADPEGIDKRLSRTQRTKS